MEDKPQISRNKPEDEAAAKPNPVSPPSASSSPSHEFSFTISLHPPSKIIDKNVSQASFAVDLSPADEIFFHGHLLPLHLLSNLPVSPRFSTDSLESFTLPIKELSEEQSKTSSTASTGTDQEYINIDHFHPTFHEISYSGSVLPDKALPGKPKPFSLFGIPKWRKGIDAAKVRGRPETDQKQKKKPKFQLSNAVKRYMRLIKPFLSLRNKSGMNHEFARQTNSLSGNLRVKSKKELRGRRGEFSAPASMRTSPTNSGLLVATAGTSTPTASDSTMEELQAAIQSAIAHCKKSIAQDTVKDAII